MDGMTFRTYDPYGTEDITDINFVLVHGLDGDSTAFINQTTSKSLLDCLRSGFPRSKIIKYVYPNNSIGMMTTKEPLPVDARALNFIQGLQNQLDNKSPIIFIGHSMGGLIIKQALITAKNTTRYKNIYDRTTSIAFYATPHTGSYLANICTKLKFPITVAVKQLKDDNPYLLDLKKEFNKIVMEKNMIILSMVEAQKNSILNRKIVDYKSAICGLNDKYEISHKLDFDHTQIQRPSSLQDRRYTDLYYFITKNVFKPNEMLNLKPDTKSDDVKDAETKDDDDEKEGFLASKKFICLDPKYDKSDDISVALRAFDQSPNLEEFTTLMAVIFSNESKSFKQKNIEDAFKDDILKQNTQLLHNLLQTKQLIEYVDENKIKKSIDLSMRYWNLLKESKSVIKEKKGQINSLLSVFKKFKQILNKKQQGNKLSDDEADFVNYVADEIIEWFADNPEIMELKKKWAELHEHLEREHISWQKILTIITEKAKQAAENAEEQIKKCSDASVIGAVCMGFGILLGGAAVAVGIIIGGTIAVAAGIIVGTIIGIGLIAKGVKDIIQNEQKKKELQLSANKSKSHLNIIEKHTAKVVKAFKEMTTDAGKLDVLFTDLVDALQEPKNQAKKVNKMRKRKKFNYAVLEINCDSIIISLTELQTVCKSILETISKAQDRFHSDD